MVSGLGMTLVYDSANRLTSAGGNTYTYDVENIRARNLCGGKETEYTYNTNAGLTQLLYTVDEDGNTVKYIYGVIFLKSTTINSLYFRPQKFLFPPIPL